MSCLRIDHPHVASLHCIAGVDHMLGVFIELMHDGRSRPNKSLDVFTLGRVVTLQAIFEFMIAEGFW